MQLTIANQPVFAYSGGRAFTTDAPVALLIHGAGHDHSVWNLLARRLAHHGFGVLAPDLPGHGRSGGAALASIEALAGWIGQFLEAAGAQRANLIGHSMGSLIALQFAAECPERVDKLVLIGSVAPMPVARPLLDAAQHDRDAAHAMINQWSYSPDAQLGRSASPGLHLPNLNLRLMERQAPGVLATDLGACNAYTEGLTAAARVAAATMLICGTRDQMTPPRAARPLHQALGNANGGARMITLEGAGHAIMAEAPEALARAIEAFLSTG
ncbi:MAG: alpha/beta hydrolase [Zoogloeaceae bacterium]|nr:alpha/beta hydrolase [Zoogloeaceae bacterium]